MTSIRFVDAAQSELLSETRFYSHARSGLGLRFVRAVQATLTRIASYPDAGTPGPAGTRRIRVRGFPFSLHYRAETDAIIIFAVAHHVREPGYWLERVDEHS